MNFGMKLQRYYKLQLLWHCNVIIHRHTQKKKKSYNLWTTVTKPRSIVESSTVEHMHSHTRHGIQVVHSQPPCVRLLYDLSLFTVSFFVSIYSLASQTPDFLKKVKGLANYAYREAVSGSSLFCGSRSGLARLILVAISLLQLSSVFHFTFCDSTTLCIVTLD